MEGMIPMLTTTSISGDGGLGKSLLAMQLMTCCGTGKRFLNRDTTECVTVGLFCEDRENQLHERQSKINNHYGITYSDASDVHYIPRVGEENALVISSYEKPTPTPFYNQFRECVLDLGAKLAVIDTAADTFMGNENIRTQVRFYVQLLNGLANDMQGAVVLLVHPSIAGLVSGTGTSGSTAWNNSVRSRWYLEKPKVEDGDENIRLLSQKKSNYSAVDSMGKELLWENGIFRLKLDEGGLIRKLKINVIADKCLNVIECCAAIGLNLSIFTHVKHYGPKIIKGKIKENISYKDIEIAFNQLLDQGKIINKSYGPPSKNAFRIEIVNKPAVPLRSNLEPIENDEYTIL